MRRAGFCVLFVASLAACSANDSGNYKGGGTGSYLEITQGEVLASRAVEIQKRNTGTGTLAGSFSGSAAGGLLLGSQFGFVGFVVGGAVGAAVGYVVEEVAGSSDGLEYLVQLDDGRTVRIVQPRGDDELIAPGTKVYVQTEEGYSSRVVERSGAVGPLPDTAWKNPDLFPPLDESAKAVEIKRRRTGTYSDAERPPKRDGFRGF